MGFQQVHAQYAKAIANQVKRQARQGRDFFTKAEQAARAFYIQAANDIGRYTDAENPYLWGSELDELPVDTGRAEPGTPA